MKEALLKKSILLGLCVTTLGFGQAEAGVMTPGNYADGTVINLNAGDIAIDQGGEYKIGGAATINEVVNSRTLILTGGAVATINGNLLINSSSSHTDEVGLNHPIYIVDGSKATFKGDVTFKNIVSTPGVWGQAIRAQGSGSEINFNGKTDIEAHHNAASAGSTSWTIVIAEAGGVINFNGETYIKNQLDNYHGSSGGANGPYASGSGSEINFRGPITHVEAIGDKPDVLTVRWGGVINFTSPVTQIIGSLDFKNGTDGNGTINAVLSGKDSYWYGDELNGSTSAPATGNLNFTYKDGAEYVPFGTYAKNQYGAKKYLSKLNLDDGGIINLYDEDAKKHWKELGLYDQWPELQTAKLDYLLVGDFNSNNGIIRMDLNDQDKSKTDMLYVIDSTAGDGQNNLEAYNENQFSNVSATNTLRFASVGPNAANKLIFKDAINIYGENLWDYELLIGHKPYDLADPENALYNSNRDGLTATQIDTLMAGGTNWYIYGYTRTPSSNVVTIIETVGSSYDMATDMDRYNKRHGEANFLEEGSNIWVRTRRNTTGRASGYSGKSTMGQIGYEMGSANNQYGIALDYTAGKFNLSTGSTENTRKGIMLYDTMTKDNGSYLDLVARFGKVYSDIDAYTKNGTVIQGDYSNSVYSLSAEYGKKLQGKNAKIFVEPQVQLQFARVGGADYTTSNGVVASMDASNSLIGRLGFRVGKDISKDSSVYFKADVLHEFVGGQDVELSSGGFTATSSIDKRGTWYDVGLGANVRLSKASYLTCDLERSFGGDLGKTWEANLGFKWAF